MIDLVYDGGEVLTWMDHWCVLGASSVPRGPSSTLRPPPALPVRRRGVLQVRTAVDQVRGNPKPPDLSCLQVHVLTGRMSTACRSLAARLCVSLSCRGYDTYTPHRNVVYHDYTHGPQTKDANAWARKYRELQRSHDRLRTLLGALGRAFQYAC